MMGFDCVKGYVNIIKSGEAEVGAMYRYAKTISLALAAMLGLSGPSFAQVTPFLGQIMIFSGNFCPNGWAPTSGQILPISQYQALFSILGTTYGGDGVHTFALPNTQPIFTKNRVSFSECIAIAGVFPTRN